MRVAILGMGNVGKRHAANLKVLGHDLIVYDIDLQACGSALAESSRWITALSLKSVWESQPEAVLICTPPDSHFDLACEALKRQIHCFIEKPLGTSAPELWREVGEQAEADNLTTFVSCNWRYHDGPARIKQALDLGFPRKPHYASIWHHSWLPSWVKGRDWRLHYSASAEQGGVLWEVGWHLVDLALWLFGDASLDDTVLYPATELGLECDGRAELMLQHGTMTTVIEANFQDEERSAAIVVHGERADKISWHLADSEAKGYDDNQMYLAEIADFLQCCQGGRLSSNPISQAIKVLDILLKAKEMGCAK